MISSEEVKDYFAYGLLLTLAVAWLCLALFPILMSGVVKWREPSLAILLFEICLLLFMALFAVERIINLLYRTTKGVKWQPQQ